MEKLDYEEWKRRGCLVPIMIIAAAVATLCVFQAILRNCERHCIDAEKRAAHWQAKYFELARYEK